jgi:hypothetical protein
MADDVELIVQLPADSELDRNLRADPPPSVTSGRVVLERLPADAEGRITPPEAGQVVASVLSPEGLISEAGQVAEAITGAAADHQPLVVLVQDAEHLREEELAALLAAAARSGQVVLLRVLSSF